MTEFWPELLTKASWEKLQKLKKEIKDFVVIGGWAVYLWTGMHKSKDIDIIVDFKTLNKFKQNYDLGKNPQLRKYEIKLEKFDIDIYVPYFSKFIIPATDVMKKVSSIQGFTVPEVEILLVLKQSAEIDRKGSIKGEKDAIDIITLLSKANFEKKKYFRILKAYNILNYAGELERLLKEFNPKNSEHVGMGFKEFQNWKRNILRELRHSN